MCVYTITFDQNEIHTLEPVAAVIKRQKRILSISTLSCILFHYSSSVWLWVAFNVKRKISHLNCILSINILLSSHYRTLTLITFVRHFANICRCHLASQPEYFIHIYFKLAEEWGNASTTTKLCSNNNYKRPKRRGKEFLLW